MSTSTIKALINMMSLFMHLVVFIRRRLMHFRKWFWKDQTQDAQRLCLGLTNITHHEHYDPDPYTQVTMLPSKWAAGVLIGCLRYKVTDALLDDLIANWTQPGGVHNSLGACVTTCFVTNFSMNKCSISIGCHTHCTLICFYELLLAIWRAARICFVMDV